MAGDGRSGSGAYGAPFGKVTVRRIFKDSGVVVRELDALIGVPGNQQVFRLVFKSRKSHQDFLKVHEGEHDRRVNGKMQKVLVVDRSLNWKFVRLVNLPTQFDLGLVQTRLKNFGVIRNIGWEVYKDKSIPELEGVKTGLLKAEMVMEDHIPSYINIGPHRVFVSYHGQTKTCCICDSMDHMAESCPSSRRAVAGISNDASTESAADNAVGRKEKSNVSTDKAKPRESSRPNKRNRTEDPQQEQEPREGSSPPLTISGQNETDVTTGHSQPMTVDPPDENPEPSSNLARSEMDLSEDLGVSNATSEIPASQVSPSESVSHVSETQESLGISDCSSWTEVAKKNDKSKPGQKKETKIPQITLTNLTTERRTRSGSNISK